MITEFVTDILLVDLIGFSKLSNEDQYKTAVIMTNNLKEMMSILVGQAFLEEQEVVLAYIPTGDGFYVLLRPELAGYGIFLAISLRNALLVASKREGGLFCGVKISVHQGEAIPFTDITDSNNYVGHGLNDCKRLQEGANRIRSPKYNKPADNNYIIVSDAAYNWFEKAYPQTANFRRYLESIHFEKGEEFEINDKHGIKHRAQFIECSRFVGIKPPPPSDIKERLKRIANNA